MSEPIHRIACSLLTCGALYPFPLLTSAPSPSRLHRLGTIFLSASSARKMRLFYIRYLKQRQPTSGCPEPLCDDASPLRYTVLCNLLSSGQSCTLLTACSSVSSMPARKRQRVCQPATFISQESPQRKCARRLAVSAARAERHAPAPCWVSVSVATTQQ